MFDASEYLKMRCRKSALLCVLMLLAGLPVMARADDSERFGLVEENDSLYFKSDKHYSQGLRLFYLGPDVAAQSGANAPFDLAARIAPIFAAPDRARRYSIFLGQSIFTPRNLTVRPPDPRDRPYAGWLYAGVSLLQETSRDRLENLELDLGLVGPGAFGRPIQADWHQFIDIKAARGWRNQIQNEIGGALSYERLWRLPLLGDGTGGVDIVPQAGATVGNVFTYAEAGSLLRIGNRLQSDYGPARIRPGLSGTDYFNAGALDGNLGFYFFVGVQGRAVARNIFLDGNSFRHSASVEHKAMVADLQAGFSLFWSSSLRADFSVVRRTPEFVGQHTPDEIGTASIAFSW